jgi:hypothetical protein
MIKLLQIYKNRLYNYTSRIAFVQSLSLSKPSHDYIFPWIYNEHK